jgi:hypothetical protein
VQGCYERWDPETEEGLRLTPTDEIASDSEGLDAVSAVQVRRHVWEAAYSRDEYLDVLGTYSGHIALPADARAGLLECIGTLIDERYEGRIVKRYLFELFVARRS